MKKLSVICMAALLLLAMSCKKNEKENSEKGPGFRATLENPTGDSKTHLVDGNKVMWTNGDKITVINGSNVPMVFTAKSGDANTVEFDNEEATQAFYTPNFTAYYPKDLYEGGHLTLQPTQTYVENTFAEGLNPMAAVSTDTDLEFMNICGMLCLQLKGTQKVTKITVTSKDNSAIWGNATLTPQGTDGEMVPVISALTDGGPSVELTCPAVQLEATAKKFYIILPDGAFPTGFNLSVTTEDGKVFTKNSSGDVKIDRSYINMLPELEVVTKEPINPTVTMTENCVNCTYSVTGVINVPATEDTQCTFGIVYSETVQAPTVGGEGCVKIDENTDSFHGDRNVTVDITKLTLNKNYYVRIYAKCDGEYAYSGMKQIANCTAQDLPDNWGNDGTSPYTFSISATKKVKFSRGNLQYNAAGIIGLDADFLSSVGGTWSFAAHQFDIIGAANEYPNVQLVNGGSIDIFGWGATGWNHNNKSYRPWDDNLEATNYYPYFVGSPNLAVYGQWDVTEWAPVNQWNLDDPDPDGTWGLYRFADWGYNAISNGGNTLNYGWHVLKSYSVPEEGATQADLNAFYASEWGYLFYGRTNAENLWESGYIACKPGVILLPDNWDWDNVDSYLQTIWNGDHNYNYLQWSAMEKAGAVYLPTTGGRTGDTGQSGDWYGSAHYWAENWNPGVGSGICKLWFPAGGAVWGACDLACSRISVRLVKDAN